MDFATAFLTPEFLQNPYPFYRVQRAAAPVAFLPQWDSWFLTDYEHINAVLRDRHFGRINPEGHKDSNDAFGLLNQNTFMEMEPPDHTRLKDVVQTIFTPRKIEALRQHMQQEVSSLIESAAGNREMNFLAEIAEPLTVMIIAELMGIPTDDRANLRSWSKAIVSMFELKKTAQTRTIANQAVQEFSELITRLADERQTNPREDLIGALSAAEQRGQVNRPELIATAILLLNAGHEATVNALGNGLLALLNHPQQVAQLRKNPSLLRPAVEEMLRFDTPLQLFNRWAMEDRSLAGFTFPRGARLSLLYGAANRDPQRFSQPDQFDITRKEISHLTFGGGIHYCLGAPLARMEMTTILSQMLARFSIIELTQPRPIYRPTFVIRGLDNLTLICR